MPTPKNSRTGLVYYAAPGWSLGDGHPECEARLRSSYAALQNNGIFDLPQITMLDAHTAKDLDIARAHVCVPDIDTQVTDSHRLAAGGGLVLADALMRGDIRNGYALVRPPGHHAHHIVHGNRGFCTINNMAILVQYLRSKYGVQKIAIVDTDVHHGDGTQDVFYHDPDVLVIGLHQDGRTLYPGTGFSRELGGPNAFARNLNVPLPMDTGDEGYHYVLQHLIRPVLDDFKPELVLQSAGLDNHFTDQLAMMQVTAKGYASFVEQLAPDLVLLEGGYAIETALPYMNLALMLALAGEDYSHVVEPGLEIAGMVQDDYMMPTIVQTVDSLLEIWQHPEQERARRYPEAQMIYTRQKDIYYDTHGISEVQQEQVRGCDACSGWVSIQSTARGPRLRQQAWTMTLPHHACSRCRQESQDAYLHIKSNASPNIDVAVLQNLADDVIYTYDFDREEEAVLDKYSR